MKERAFISGTQKAQGGNKNCSRKMGLKPLVAIVGNTGVGKSQFAVDLAKALNGEVINADAMQMYQGLDIISNKHPIAERQGVPHHLLGTESWNNQITVQDFEVRAQQVIDKLHAENKLPILVGGTHYYIQSLITKNNLINNNEAPIAQKEFSAKELEILNDSSKVEAELKRVDPVIASKFHPNDTRRLRRALEIWYETGKKPSSIYESQKGGSEDEKLQMRYNVLVYWVWSSREVLTPRLDARVDKMVDQGLQDELKGMYRLYNGQSTGIWQVLGFKQFLNYLATPTQENWDQGLQDMKTDTRHYAKKQTKWIKNKLGPLLQELGGKFALVDASDLSQWNTNVRDRGITIAKEWLKENMSTDLVPGYLAGEIVRKRQPFSQHQWVRHRCDVCSEVKETVLMGDDEWKIHLQSKGHRYHVKRAAKEK